MQTALAGSIATVVAAVLFFLTPPERHHEGVGKIKRAPGGPANQVKACLPGEAASLPAPTRCHGSSHSLSINTIFARTVVMAILQHLSLQADCRA